MGPIAVVLDVQREPQQHEIPADPDGARTEAHRLPLGIGMRTVLDGQMYAVIDRRQVGLDPRHVALVLPRDAESSRWFTVRDLTTGIALDLIAAAQSQVAADRRQPTRDALR